MQSAKIPDEQNDPSTEKVCIAHFAVSVDSAQAGNDLTDTIDTIRKSGFRVLSEPRTTGAGYYESIVLDPDGNRVEITS